MSPKSKICQCLGCKYVSTWLVPVGQYPWDQLNGADMEKVLLLCEVTMLGETKV